MIVTFILKALSWVVLQIFSVVTPVMPDAVMTAFAWALNQAVSGIGILGLFLDLKFCAGFFFWSSGLRSARARDREGCFESPLPTSGLHSPRNELRATRP